MGLVFPLALLTSLRFAVETTPYLPMRSRSGERDARMLTTPITPPEGVTMLPLTTLPWEHFQKEQRSTRRIREKEQFEDGNHIRRGAESGSGGGIGATTTSPTAYYEFPKG